ncbi:hypothetical protein M3Y99_00835300 [Aphelenchoides fujianensis]|nr:hypothetical protein M3Y99_00835300 [Aphelenchoides fujianensis]
MDTTGTPAQQPVDETPAWVLWANGFELLICVLIEVSLVNAYIIFNKKKLFHKNLVLLIAHTALGFNCLCSCRLVICLAAFFDPRINVCSKRVIATVRLRSYEQAFIFVNVKNRQHVRRRSSAFTLSQRYQINENTRVLSIIIRSVCCFCVCMPFLIASFTLGLYVDAKSGNTIYFARAIINGSSTLFCLVVLNVAILSTHPWRVQFREHVRLVGEFLRLRSRYVPSSKKKGQVFVITTDGVPLSFNPKEEEDIYFSQLKQAWL